MTNNKFYQLTREERLAELVERQKLSSETAAQLASDTPISPTIAANMIENQISQYAVPLGVAPDFLVNGQLYQIPMAIEEPSVIAAASNAAKMASKNGGFTAQIKQRAMTGEVVLTQLTDLKKAAEWCQKNVSQLQQVAQSAHPSIVKRGGGLSAIQVIQVDAQFLKLNLTIDTKEAMGANIVNTICEAVASEVQAQVGGEILLSVLTNAAEASLVSAQVKLDPATLSTQQMTGLTVAKKMVQATTFAKVDWQRAATHNKGIMNGVDAVVLATGNDWRAIEAGAHSFAASTGQYLPLTDWTLTENKHLLGTITLPLPVGFVGGSIGLLPTVQAAHELLGVKSAAELAMVIAAVGLGQNLAALKALVTDGIQKGHMALQARSLALASGATASEVAPLVAQLLIAPHMNSKTAADYLARLRQA